MNLFKAALFSVSLFSMNTAFATSKPAKKAKPNPSAALFDVVSSLEKDNCGMGSCWIDISEVSCTWRNGPNAGGEACSYKNEAGDIKRITGAKAAKLANAVEAAGKVDSDCGAGTCGFQIPQDVSCGFRNGTGLHKATCSVSDHADNSTTQSPKESEHTSDPDSGK